MPMSMPAAAEDVGTITASRNGRGFKRFTVYAIFGLALIVFTATTNLRIVTNSKEAFNRWQQQEQQQPHGQSNLHSSESAAPESSLEALESSDFSLANADVNLQDNAMVPTIVTILLDHRSRGASNAAQQASIRKLDEFLSTFRNLHDDDDDDAGSASSHNTKVPFGAFDKYRSGLVHYRFAQRVNFVKVDRLAMVAGSANSGCLLASSYITDAHEMAQHQYDHAPHCHFLSVVPVASGGVAYEIVAPRPRSDGTVNQHPQGQHLQEQQVACLLRGNQQHPWQQQSFWFADTARSPIANAIHRFNCAGYWTNRPSSQRQQRITIYLPSTDAASDIRQQIQATLAEPQATTTQPAERELSIAYVQSNDVVFTLTEDEANNLPTTRLDFDYVKFLLNTTISVIVVGDAAAEPASNVQDTNGLPLAVHIQEILEAGSLPIIFNMSPQSMRCQSFPTLFCLGGNTDVCQQNGPKPAAIRSDDPTQQGIHGTVGGSDSDGMQRRSIILEVRSVNELQTQVRGLLQDAEQMDRYQKRVSDWYENFMIRSISHFESNLINSPSRRTTFETKAKGRMLQTKSRLNDYQSQAHPQHKQATRTLPFCLEAFYGRSNNRIITLAKAIHFANRYNTTLALTDEWSEWYSQVFDPRDDIFHGYHPYGKCGRVLRGIRMYFTKLPNPLPELRSLIPKRSIREEAEGILQRIASTFGTREQSSAASSSSQETGRFISVHRRDLEGTCLRRAGCLEYRSKACQERRPDDHPCSTTTVQKMCKVVQPDIHNPDSLPIILFTDGQRPEYDDTFAIAFNNSWASSFLVQQWVMTQSQIHYGNPLSTVDDAIHHWRHAKPTEPAQCYPVLDD